MRKKAKKNHKVFKTLLICFVIIALIGLRYIYLKSGSFKPSSKVATGTITTKYVDVFSQNNSKVKTVFVKENDFVKKGDKLFQLETSIIDAKINRIKAKITYEKEKANYFKFNEEKALEGYLNAKKDTTQDVKEINDKLSHLEKMQLLYKIERAKIDFLNSENAYLQEEKQKHIIISPKDGQIVDLDIFQDKYIDVKDKLFTIADSENIWVDIKVNKKELSKYQIGKNLDLKINDFSYAKFQGTIFDISSFDDEDDFINLKLSINQIKESPEEKTVMLKTGMTAKLMHEKK